MIAALGLLLQITASHADNASPAGSGGSKSALPDESAFAKGAQGVLVINLLKFDSEIGDIDARLLFKLPKSELNAQFSPRQDYYLVDELTTGESILPIKASVPYSAFDNDLATTYEVDDAGTQFFYPFDYHHAEIKIFVHRQEGQNADGPVMVRQPVTVDTSLCSFEGYNITLAPGKDNAPDFVDLHVVLQRTPVIKVFTLFISVLMLLVAIGFLQMVIKLARSHVPPDINEMAFGAALLFAFPAIRTTEPFVPAMGVLSDYLGFFWAESLVAIAVIIQLVCWLKRKKHE